MKENNLKYEDYLMACLGSIEERWKIISSFKDVIEVEGDNNVELKMKMTIDMENSFDEIDSQYKYFSKTFVL